MLYSILVLNLTTIIYMIPLLVFLPFQLSWVKKVILYFIIIANLCMMSLFIGNRGIIILLLTVGIYISWLDSHRVRNISILIFSYLFDVVITNITSSTLWVLADISIEKIHTTPIINILMSCSDMLIIYTISKLLVLAYHKISGRIDLSLLSGRTLLFININLLLTLCLFVVNIVEGENIGYSPKVVGFNTFVFLAYFLVTTWTIIRSVQMYKKESDMKIKQSDFDAMQKYTDQVEKLYGSLRSFKHDYVNILMTMYGYMDNRDMEGLSEYFQEHILPLTNQLAPENYHIGRLANLKIVELKSLVTAKLIYAQEMKIELTIEIDTPVEHINTDIIDLSRILGNFLDNAIEAALETDEPRLSFVVIVDEKNVIFMIGNSFVEGHTAIGEISKSGFSTKGEHRGLGLYNVSQIVAQHRELYLETYAENGIFMQILHVYSDNSGAGTAI